MICLIQGSLKSSGILNGIGARGRNKQFYLGNEIVCPIKNKLFLNTFNKCNKTRTAKLKKSYFVQSMQT